MNYVLKEDGTFRKVKKLKKKDFMDAKYCLIDISTDRKGPVYTLVKNPVFDFTENTIQIDIDATYAPFDCPFDESMLLHSSFLINSVEKYYNVYPLINQMYNFNIFRDYFDEIDNHINIETITVQYNDTKIEIGEYDYFGKSLKKTFRRMHMTTNVNDVLFDQIILLKNNRWEICGKDNDMEYLDFDKVVIPVSSSESMYLLSYEEFILFQEIKSISIENRYVTQPNWYSDDCNNIEDDENYINVIYINDFDRLLETCMFYPQMILMEQAIYNMNSVIRITIETYTKELTLFITDKETEDPRNMCLYKIIKKLLKM